MDNLELWDKVCVTDAKITKQVEYGKRKFTSIDAQYQIKRATELWGPYGWKWGLKNCIWGELNGELTLDAVFFYPFTRPEVFGNPKMAGSDSVATKTDICSFEISSDIKHIAGGECRKKLMTDVTTKALSKLGFNSDVFEGRFDGNRYATEKDVRKTFSAPKNSALSEAQTTTNKPMTGTMSDPQKNAIIKIGLKEGATEQVTLQCMTWYAEQKGETEVSKQSASEMITGFKQIYKDYKGTL